MNTAQFESVLALPAQKRYAHFVGKVSDWEEVWSLKNDKGFVSYGDDEGKQGIPFWPHLEYAKAVATNDWSDCTPERIELDRFLENWLPGMNGDGVMAVVFPTPAEKGIIMDPLELLGHIEEECRQYE